MNEVLGHSVHDYNRHIVHRYSNAKQANAPTLLRSACGMAWDYPKCLDRNIEGRPRCKRCFKGAAHG
jgi:hypothetical protein